MNWQLIKGTLLDGEVPTLSLFSVLSQILYFRSIKSLGKLTLHYDDIVCIKQRQKACMSLLTARFLLHLHGDLLIVF